MTNRIDNALCKTARKTFNRLQLWRAKHSGVSARDSGLKFVGALLFILVFAACQPLQAPSTLESVLESGVVQIGVRNDNPPMSFIDESGEWIGFDIDLANALAEEMGVEIELVVVDGTTRITFLQEGRVDMSVASMNHTRQRDNAIDFSITYFWDNQSFLIRNRTYASIDELFGQTVAANAGSSAIPSWTEYVAAAGGKVPEIVEFGDKLAAMQALRDGAVEGYTEDNITLLALAAGDPELELLPGGHNPVQFGIGVPINDSAWRDQVNYALQELWKSGVYSEIYSKWFEGPEAVLPIPLAGEMEIWPE
ncbi:MAG: transporter substrate-binding domain-containing protein [Chloroflexota bacterium]